MTSEEIQAIFFVECEESLAAAEAGLLACQSGTQDADTINAVFRGVHSIKGGAGAFGFVGLQAFTHCFETLLSDVRDGSVQLTDRLIELMLRALDILSDHVTAARGQGKAPDDAAMLEELTAAQACCARTTIQNDPPAPSAIAAEPAPVPDESEMGFDLDLDALLDDISGDTVPEEPELSWIVRLRPHAGAMTNGGEPLLLLRELAGTGARCIGCDHTAVPPLDRLDLSQGYLGWTFEVPANVPESTVRDIFEFIGDDCGLAVGSDAAMPAVQIAMTAPGATNASHRSSGEGATALPVAAAQPTAGGGQTIRVELTKLDRLINTVGELVIAQAMLTQRLGTEVSAGEELALLDGLVRDIQESAMSIRAQPIGTAFSRLPRILRELTASTGKQVRLELSGEATELDKTVIERLGEPLTHLMRNAVDHGIETPAEREAVGKSAEGTLRFSAEHRSGRILIRISDDGRGINRARVLAKAVEKGLIAADAQLSNEEIDMLIFAPGFSTAQTVSNISGRGVGMDVVRQNVKALGGRISIESTEGVGTNFILTLPLTLAISDGMIVKAGGQTLVVPLANVVESLRPDNDDIKGLGAHRRMLNVRGRFLPIVPVGAAIGVPANAQGPGVLMVVDTEGAGQAALLVDEICDQRQFVIKSLDTNYRAVDGVAGATILGDGQVALILDVEGLVAGAMLAAATPEAA